MRAGAPGVCVEPGCLPGCRAVGLGMRSEAWAGHLHLGVTGVWNLQQRKDRTAEECGVWAAGPGQTGQRGVSGRRGQGRAGEPRVSRRGLAGRVITASGTRMFLRWQGRGTGEVSPSSCDREGRRPPSSRPGVDVCPHL